MALGAASGAVAAGGHRLDVRTGLIAMTAPADRGTEVARRVICDAGEYTLLGENGEQFRCVLVLGEWQLTRLDVPNHRMQPFPTLRSAQDFVGTWYGRG